MADGRSRIQTFQLVSCLFIVALPVTKEKRHPGDIHCWKRGYKICLMANHSDAPDPVERSVARACTGFASAEGSRQSGADTKSHYPVLNAANWDAQETPGENKAVDSRKGTTGILFKQPDNLACAE